VHTQSCLNPTPKAPHRPNRTWSHEEVVDHESCGDSYGTCEAVVSRVYQAGAEDSPWRLQVTSARTPKFKSEQWRGVQLCAIHVDGIKTHATQIALGLPFIGGSERPSRNSLGSPHPDGGIAPPGAVNDAASSTHRHQAAVKRTTGQRDGAGAGGLPPHLFWPGAFKSFGAALFVPIP